MRKIDWISKLTSRKWWTSIISFVTLMVIAFGGTESTATQVASIIMAGAVVIGYTIGEGLVDKRGANGDITIDALGVDTLTTEAEEEDK